MLLLPSLGYCSDPGTRVRRRARNLRVIYLICVVEGYRRASGQTLRPWFASCPGMISSGQSWSRIEGDGFGTLFECKSFPRVPSSLEMSIVPWW